MTSGRGSSPQASRNGEERVGRPWNPPNTRPPRSAHAGHLKHVWTVHREKTWQKVDEFGTAIVGRPTNTVSKRSTVMRPGYTERMETALPGPPGDEEYELALSNWKLRPVAGRTRHQPTPEATRENTRRLAPGIQRMKEAARPVRPPERASHWDLLGRTTT